MAHSLIPSMADTLGQDLAVTLGRWTDSLVRRTRSVAAFFDVRMESLISAWIALTVLAGCGKVATAPLPLKSFGDFALQLLPYLFVALAPVAGYRIAAGSFPRGLLSAQPSIRIARLGKWHRVNPVDAQRSPVYGPSGLMASLLVGILLNVPVRTLEYLGSVPSVGTSAPGWAQTLHLAMTADVIVMNFFYMVCFVMALRSVPLFPRMLLFVWTVDVCMQLMIADMVAHSPGLPGMVAKPLERLLSGNLDKVFISAFVWLPYLLLSDRANITFRHRVRAA